MWTVHNENRREVKWGSNVFKFLSSTLNFQYQIEINWKSGVNIICHLINT